MTLQKLNVDSQAGVNLTISQDGKEYNMSSLIKVVILTLSLDSQAKWEDWNEYRQISFYKTVCT